MIKNTIRKIGFALIWLSFVVYAFVFAPSPQPDTLETILKLSSGQWADLNPAVVALFNLMGLWPMVYACLMLIDGVGQKIPAWPFVMASFAVGAFAVLPYFALREPTPNFVGERTKLINVVDSPWTGRAIAFGSLILLGYGLFNGDWSDFAQQWRTSQFIHVMSLDFCMLSVLVSPLVKTDMVKRGMRSPVLFWSATLMPLLGVLLYLSVRSPLQTSESSRESKVTSITGAAS